jgi:hypothetical protein
MKNIKSFSGLCLLALIPVMFVVIAVSAAATGCDNDNICEAGENVLWCPNDCTVLASCGDGFCDANEQGNCAADCPPANCTPTNGGTEICDGVDNNCDGLVDDGLPLICKWLPSATPICIPTAASQSFSIFLANPNNNTIAIKWLDNGATAQTDGINYTFTGNASLVGAHAINVSANNTATSNVISKEWVLNVKGVYYNDSDGDGYGNINSSQELCVASSGWVLNSADCNDGNNAIKPGAQEPFDSVDNDCDSQTDEATFWGRVTDAKTGAALAGKNLSFYQDTGIESKYSDPALLENYTYETWQTLAPKATPDLVTDADGYFYAELADGTYNYVIQGSREDEMEVVVNDSQGAKKRDSELNENISSVNFNAEGHILYAGKYEQQNESDTTNGNKYTCGQKVRFIMFGVNNGGTDETITFAVQNHTSNGGPNAPIIYTGNLSNTNEKLTVLAYDKSEKYFDWQIVCPKTAGRYDIHVVWNGDVWHKIGNFFVVEDTTLPEINLGGITSVTTFTNQPVTIGYYAGDVLQTGTMPDVIMQIAGQVVGGVPDTSITVKVNKDVVNNPTGVDITAFGGESEVNLTYNQSGYYAANFTATDQSGNTAYRQVNISVFITEDEADAIALPFYTTYCTLNETGFNEFQYDINTTLTDPVPAVNLIADRYSVPGFGDAIGDEYLTPNDGLEQWQIDAINGDTDCSPEWFKVINMTTASSYCSQLYDFFAWIDSSCYNVCPAFPATTKATVCGT